MGNTHCSARGTQSKNTKVLNFDADDLDEILHTNNHRPKGWYTPKELAKKHNTCHATMVHRLRGLYEKGVIDRKPFTDRSGHFVYLYPDFDVIVEKQQPKGWISAPQYAKMIHKNPTTVGKRLERMVITEKINRRKFKPSPVSKTYYIYPLEEVKKAFDAPTKPDGYYTAAELAPLFPFSSDGFRHFLRRWYDEGRINRKVSDVEVDGKLVRNVFVYDLYEVEEVVALHLIRKAPQSCT